MDHTVHKIQQMLLDGERSRIRHAIISRIEKNPPEEECPRQIVHGVFCTCDCAHANFGVQVIMKYSAELRFHRERLVPVRMGRELGRVKVPRKLERVKAARVRIPTNEYAQEPLVKILLRLMQKNQCHSMIVELRPSGAAHHLKYIRDREVNVLP